MSPSSVSIRVPGKALLAGEYAVLAGVPAVVAAVDRFLACSAAPSERWSLEGAGARWTEGEPEPEGLRFPLRALRLALQYAEGRGASPRARSLRIEDGLRAPDGKKLGLGGSAASCVLAAAAGLSAAGLEPSPDLVFQLAAAAHSEAQARPGSNVDVAACAYGGVLWLRRHDPAPVIAAARASPASLVTVLDRLGPPEIERLPAPAGLLLAFEGSAASTPRLLEQVERFAEREPAEFAGFVARSAAAADRLRRALLARDVAGQVAAVERAGGLLEHLGRSAEVPLVSEGHRRVIELARSVGAAAKISGAGGGDCAVALGEPAALARLQARLRDAGAYCFLASVAPGVTIGEATGE